MPVSILAAASSRAARRYAKALCLLALSAAWGPATAEPLERQLDISLAVNAKQSWRNGDQHSEATTRQRYDWSTRLRSDGHRYVDNLLDPDPKRRALIRRNYDVYQGLLQLQQENAGRLPAANAVRDEISTAWLLQNPDCYLGGDRCPRNTPERAAAVIALRKQPLATIEALLKSYEATGGQWLYFRGYIGCPNLVKLNYRSNFSGERVLAGDARPKSFEIEWTANTKGSARERKYLCQAYLATLNTVSGDFYVENLYVPAPRGASASKIDGQSEQDELTLPVPEEVRLWADALLKNARSSGEQQLPALPLNQALDAQNSRGGTTQGSAKVVLRWEFKEPDAPGEAPSEPPPLLLDE